MAEQGIHKPRVTGSSPVAAIELTSICVVFGFSGLTTLDNFSPTRHAIGGRVFYEISLFLGDFLQNEQGINDPKLRYRGISGPIGMSSRWVAKVLFGAQRFSVKEDPQYRIKKVVQALSHVFGQEAKNEVPVLLQ